MVTMGSVGRPVRSRPPISSVLPILPILALAAAPPALAHQGPPYPILVDRVMGPGVVSVWADPDVGTGTFYITVEAPPGRRLPANLTVEAVPHLSTVAKEATRLSTYAEEVTRIEGRADEQHDEGLKALYLAHRDGNAMDYIIGHQIYGHLEKVVDRFEDVANEIHSLVIEHA